ncbi:unnamed protein product [Candidula unifasciata]|uniref:non-specific serine/threonine protein kinase n=1 Tax=Candidula unifasciata TaxID=100452 RepID=A0A8S3ZEQ2_9EUPU|nr:unnamed protein product [Candidula unifasciata]
MSETSTSSSASPSAVDSLPSDISNVTSFGDSTNCNNIAMQRPSGPRKNSAERNIIHTRMEDTDVCKEYEYGESLGEGSFGKVYRARHIQSGETVAIKEIVKERAGSSGLRQLEKEVSIFKKVDHRNIIKLKEVIESSKKMYLIMELCEGGDLAKLLQKQSHLTEGNTKIVMSDLAAAIKYLHQQGVIHRDLKLENILLAEDPSKNGNIVIKVSDFGLSTQQINNSYENMQEQFCGTLSYMAPEMNSTYSYPVDVWAMGIIMYYLLTRYPKDNVLNESIAKDGPRFEEPQWKSISDQAKDLLKAMLTVNPAYRLSSGEVLNHEWFTGKKREHGNVLELMKDFVREQKELSDKEECLVNESEKQKKETDHPCSSRDVKAGKKDPRKGLGAKTVSTDTAHKTAPSSSGTVRSKLRSSSSSSRTSTSRASPARTAQEGTGKSSPATSKTTSNNVRTQTGNYGPIDKPPKIATQSKIKKK